MRIGIDIDDTICDTWEYSLPFFSKYFGINLAELKERIRDRYDILGFTHEAYLRFLSDCYKEFINDVPLKEGAKEVINKLKENGNEIIFITARSNRTFKDAYTISYNYLQKNGICFDKLYISGGTKKEFCEKENIDIFIDDSIRNCLCVKELGIDVLCFNPLHECDIYKVNNWDEVENYIEKRPNLIGGLWIQE